MHKYPKFKVNVIYITTDTQKAGQGSRKKNEFISREGLTDGVTGIPDLEEDMGYRKSKREMSKAVMLFLYVLMF